MQSIDDLRRRMNPRAQWVQLSVLAASVAAPLVARWNELRATERASDIRDEAEARLRALAARAPKSRDEVQQQIADMLERAGLREKPRRANTAIWLAGVGVGLAVAGAGAYVLIRRRLAQSTDYDELEMAHDSAAAHDGAATAAVAAQPVASQPADQPGETWTSEAASSIEQEDIPAAEEGDVAVPPVPAEGDSAAGDVAPQFVCNIRTMVYHDADSDHLPAEDNRIYFTTADEAREAGFRPDHGEHGTAEPPASETHASE